MTIPILMQAVVVRAYAPGFDNLALAERAVPTPGPGQVLVRIAASPINPSDLMFVQGLYGVRKPLPAVGGFEASGLVVAAGADAAAQRLLGKRVAALSGGDNDGAWAEYMLASAALCVPVPDDIDDEAASTLIINPYTAWALVDLARAAGTKAIVQTAAGSALGRMIQRLAATHGICVINVVRRPEQVAELLEADMGPTLSSIDANFDINLATLCKNMDARLAFDAVGGALTGQVARALRPGGRVIVYGGLSGEEPRIGVDQLIFRDKMLEGFWLSSWLPSRSTDELAQLAVEIPALARDTLSTDTRARYPLGRFREALADYAGHMSGGKVLFVPHGAAL
ncbi:MAG TPA: zinc-binding dehydrogenase [Thermoflexales bacterium]|nr:zinc-binding dehydrogenase [Thermoflexales bacterium]